MKKCYWLFFNIRLSTVHINFGDFLLNEFLQKRGKFPLLITFLLAPSGCGVNRARLQRDVRKGTPVLHCRASRWQRNGEQVRGGWVFEHP